MIRGKVGHRDNPSCVEFRPAYRDSCIDAMFVKAKNSNCEGEFDSFLLKLASFDKCSDNVPVVEASDTPSVDSQDPVNMSLPQVNVTAYVSGYLLRKTKGRGLCCICEKACICKDTDKELI